MLSDFSKTGHFLRYSENRFTPCNLRTRMIFHTVAHFWPFSCQSLFRFIDTRGVMVSQPKKTWKIRESLGTKRVFPE